MCPVQIKPVRTDRENLTDRGKRGKEKGGAGEKT